ncbi:MAG: hypothetical protein JNL44_16615, partial [Gemmatimonadetes bacterium]|nr:hypothetical protein [Gemmatimonadota bacterium]
MTERIARRGILALALAAAGFAFVAAPAGAREMQWRRRHRRRWVRRRRWRDEPDYVERHYGPPRRRYGLSARDRMLIDRQQVPSSY